MSLDPVVALEIGTSKVIGMVGEVREGGHLLITGMGVHPSVGVRKGEIVDLESAVICVRAVLDAAEESSKVSIRNVHLAVSGGHIQSLVNRGSIPILSKDREITEAHVEQVMDVARAINLPPERDIIHTICQHFSIDDRDRVVRPEGMEGTRLSLDMLMLHGIRNQLRNTIRVVKSIPMSVQDVAFSGLCSALAVLSPEQKRNGVIVIDLGGGTTDYVAYRDDAVAAAGVIAVGGDHVTNDVAVAFDIPTLQAEALKRDAGTVVAEDGDDERRVAVPPDVGFQGKSIAATALRTVVHARMDETLRMVRQRVEDADALRSAASGVVLTGGGVHTRGLVKLTEQVFGLPGTIGKPRNVSGLATATEGPEYASCVGMVQYAFHAAGSQKQGAGLGGWLKGLFRR
jgi:cell division protein FtsA